MKKFVPACLGVFLLASASLPAQETSRFAFDLGGGFTTPLTNAGTKLDNGWGVRGGAGVNINSHIGVMLNLGYDSLGVNTTTLGNLGVNNGNMNIFSARIDPVLHVGSYHHADVYVTGGGGLYHQYQEFGSSVSTRTVTSDPFFGYSPTSPLLSSYSVNKPGIDGGLGVAFGSKWHGKFFAEARFNRIFLENSHTDYLPVSFGFRW